MKCKGCKKDFVEENLYKSFLYFGSKICVDCLERTLKWLKVIYCLELIVFIPMIVLLISHSISEGKDVPIVGLAIFILIVGYANISVFQRERKKVIMARNSTLKG